MVTVATCLSAATMAAIVRNDKLRGGGKQAGSRQAAVLLRTCPVGGAGPTVKVTTGGQNINRKSIK